MKLAALSYLAIGTEGNFYTNVKTYTLFNLNLIFRKIFLHGGVYLILIL